MSRAAIASGFDRLPFYDVLASVGMLGAIHRSQVALLPRIGTVQRALVLGGGTGRFLAELLAAQPACRAVSIDLSPAMTSRTVRRLQRRGLAERAELRVGSLEQIAADETFDLVATHCFLDLFDEAGLGVVVERLAAALAPGGRWMFSDFDDQGAPSRHLFVQVLYAFFRVTSRIDAAHLPHFDAAFTRAGLRAIAESSHAAGLLRALVLQKP